MEEIDNLIFEVNELLVKLNKIRESKTISCSLTKSFKSILNSIEDILDNQPTPIDSESSERNYNLNLNENSIKRKFFCEICSDYIHDDFSSLQTHISSSKHVYSKQNLVKLESQLLSNKIKMCTVIVDPSQQDIMLQIMYNQIKPLEHYEQNNFRSYGNFLQSFLPIMSAKYQVNSVNLIGSRLFCISKPSSDYNVVINLKDKAFLHQDSDPKLLISNVSYILQFGTKFKVCDSSASSIQLKDLSQNLMFKISLTNSVMKVSQGLLIKYLFQSSLHRKVCHIILNISQIRNFESSSYYLVLLLLYYYQAKNILPPICYLLKDLPPINCGAWQVNFAPKPLYVYCGQNSLIDNYENCILNLIDFFKFYAIFDFKNNVICPHLGCAIPKTEFENVMLRIPSYQSFLKQANATPFKMEKRCGNIQDPIELNVNNFMSKRKGRNFEEFCKEVLETNIIYLPKSCKSTF